MSQLILSPIVVYTALQASVFKEIILSGKQESIPMNNTHDLLVGTLSIGVPSYSVLANTPTLENIAYGIVCTACVGRVGGCGIFRLGIKSQL